MDFAPAPTVVVAGLWVRPLAQAARQAGWRVIALDLFGDADTRRASIAWERIGDPSSFTLDLLLLRTSLQRAAAVPGVIGWIAGSGFEPQAQALDLHWPTLPLLGMTGVQVKRVRDPRVFFAVLDELGLDHPQVAFTAPEDPRGWLRKNANGSGGWHIRPAVVNAAHDPGSYHQRWQLGQPMSALFLADGAGARLVALNRLIVRPLGDLPCVYQGAIGPIVDHALAQHLQQALARLVPAFVLRGLASLDFMADAGRAWLLEINPRPSASMALHAHAWPGGLLRAHVQAMAGTLPAGPPVHAPGVRGCLTVFAPADCRVPPALAAELAQAADCHDLPAPDARFSAGEPVCTVSATAADADAVLAALDARADQLRGRLSPSEALAA